MSRASDGVNDNEYDEDTGTIQYTRGDIVTSGTSCGQRIPFPYWRWIVVVMIGLGIFVAYLQRVCVSTAVVTMKDEFHWSDFDAGLVQSAFYIGYIFPQIPGGWLAARIGGKWVFFGGVLWLTAFTLLTPVTAPNFWLLLLARIGGGLGSAVTYPTMNVMLALWVPASERSTAVPIAWGGSYLGTIASMALSGPMIEAWGWQSVFYVFGGGSMLNSHWMGVGPFLCLRFAASVFLLLWILLVSSTPEDHPCITQAEVFYLSEERYRSATVVDEKEEIQEDVTVLKGAASTETTGHSETTVEVPEKHGVPWKLFFMRTEVWAIIIAHFCYNWGFYVLLSWIPTYFDQALGFDLDSSSLLSATPYIALWCVALFAGVLSDYLLTKRNWNRTLLRKLMVCVGYVVPMYFLFWIAFVQNGDAAFLLVTIAVAFSGFSLPGYASNHMDILPEHAGVLLGITNTIAQLPGMFGVSLAGFIVSETGSFALVFIITALVYLVGALAFGIFASGYPIDLENGGRRKLPV